MTRTITMLLLLALVAGAQDVFIRNADVVHTALGPALKNCSVLVKDGKIAAIGSDLEAPEGVRVIEGKGRHVSPGMIDAHSHIAGSGGLNEGTHSITCEVRIIDVLNPEDPTIYRALAGGCTAAHLMHGSANVIGGQNCTVKLKYKRPAEDMVVQDAPRTVKFALGENPKRSNSRGGRRGDTPRRFPTSRMGVEALLREAFESARTYRAAWAAYEKKIADGKNAIPPRRDLRKDALVDILEGRLKVHSHCYRADEILMLLELADDFGFKVSTLHHVLEGYKVAPEIAAHGAGGATFTDWWGYKVEAYDAVPHNAAIMHRHGVLVSIKSDSGDQIRRLNTEAAKCIKYGGLSPLEALRLVTFNPAKQLGIDHRTGSLKVGMDADLAIWNGDPLSTLTRCDLTLVEGEVFFDRKQDLAKRAGYQRALTGGDK